MSKTEWMLNEIGRTLDDDPQPLLYVGPTEKNVRSMSVDRVLPMIESTPSLNAFHVKGHGDKVTEKRVRGVRLGFAWAGSATELASHPAAKIFIDERDRMKPIGEGDVDSILKEAVATYAGQIFRVSTPLLGDVVREWDEDLGRDHWGIADPDDLASPIWALWQEASRHEWHVACLHCRVYFAPHLELLKYDEEAQAEKLFESAILACPHCGGAHTNSQKNELNARGVFVAPDERIEPYPKNAGKKNPPTGAKINGIPVKFGSYLDRGKSNLSFWVSGLCSPWSPFGSRAEELKKALDSKEVTRIQGVVNTQFGQVYKPKGQAPEWMLIKDLQRGYERHSIPAGVQVITVGVDVHARRLNYVIRGWGYGYESWLIDQGELHGECKYIEDSSWQALREILTDIYGDSQQRLGVSLMLIDAGFKPNDDPAPSNVIYQFCHANKRAQPAKGYDQRNRPFSASKIDVTVQGKVVKGGLQMWHLDSDWFKSFIYGRYEWEVDQPGGWHLYNDIDDEYCRQVTAESRHILSSGKPKWEPIRRANHFLDAEVMAVSAAHILRLHRLQPIDGSGKRPAKRSGRKVHRSM